MKTKTTVQLTSEELVQALQQGIFKDRKIKNAEWQYKTKWYDDGRGGEHETVCTGIILEIEA